MYDITLFFVIMYRELVLYILKQDESYIQQQEMMEAFETAACECQIDVIAGWGALVP